MMSYPTEINSKIRNKRKHRQTQTPPPADVFQKGEKPRSHTELSLPQTAFLLFIKPVTRLCDQF